MEALTDDKEVKTRKKTCFDDLSKAVLTKKKDLWRSYE